MRSQLFLVCESLWKAEECSVRLVRILGQPIGVRATDNVKDPCRIGWEYPNPTTTNKSNIIPSENFEKRINLWQGMSYLKTTVCWKGKNMKNCERWIKFVWTTILRCMNMDSDASIASHHDICYSPPFGKSCSYSFKTLLLENPPCESSMRELWEKCTELRQHGNFESVWMFSGKEHICRFITVVSLNSGFTQYRICQGTVSL